ncbi:unnamed protein product, partial [Gulo gulo]
MHNCLIWKVLVKSSLQPLLEALTLQWTTTDSRGLCVHFFKGGFSLNQRKDHSAQPLSRLQE